MNFDHIGSGGKTFYQQSDFTPWKASLLLGTALLLLTVLVPGSSVYAQTDALSIETDIKPFTAGGSVTLMGQLYSADGISNRRAPAMAQVNASTNFSLFGIQSGLNLFYSTDQKEFRQNMNDLSFNGSYRWITLHVGDVAPNYSTYGLGDVSIRGGAIEMTPGKVQIKAAVGQSQRAIGPGAGGPDATPAYRRWIYAGKFGVGSDGGSHFHLSAMYAKDQAQSLSSASTLPVKPKENLTVTPDIGLTIVPNHLTLKSAVTFSALTRDLTSDKLSLSGSGVPSFVTKIFQPRLSTRINYAGQANLNFQTNPFSLGLGYERIQPGFTSLGKSRVRDDFRSIHASPSLTLINGKMNLSSSISFGRNNLLGDRLSTRKTRSYSFNLQTQFSPTVSLNTNYNHLLNKNLPASDTLSNVPSQRFTSNNIQLQPTFTIRSGQKTHNISVTGSFQSSQSKVDNNASNATSRINNKTFTTALSYSLTLPSSLSLTGTTNYLINKSQQLQNRTLGVNAGTSYAFFDRKLRLSLNAGYNQNTSERPSASDRKMRLVSLNLNASYNLTSSDSFQLMLRTRKSTIASGAGRSFTEFQGQFQYSHQF